MSTRHLLVIHGSIHKKVLLPSTITHLHLRLCPLCLITFFIVDDMLLSNCNCQKFADVQYMLCIHLDHILSLGIAKLDLDIQQFRAF